MIHNRPDLVAERLYLTTPSSPLEGLSLCYSMDKSVKFSGGSFASNMAKEETTATAGT